MTLSILGVIWDSFGSRAEFCSNLDVHFDVIFFKCVVFGECCFLSFFLFLLKPNFQGLFEKYVHLGCQGEAGEKSFAGFLGSRRKAGK